MIKYQQGDVLFIKQDDVNTDKGWNVTTEKKYGSNETVNRMKPGDKMGGYHSTEHETAYVNGKAEGKKLTVAFGEVTGHSHSFYMDKNPPGVEITAFGRRSTSVGDIPVIPPKLKEFHYGKGFFIYLRKRLRRTSRQDSRPSL